MTSKIPQIIGEPKDGSEFRNRRVRAQYVGEDDILLNLSFDTTDFGGLLGLRGQRQDASRLEESLKGEGYLLANVGISGLFVVNYQRENYLLTTMAERVDRAEPDSVKKLLSGYVPAEIMYDPERHMRIEIAEEFLPMIDGKVIPGTLDSVVLDRPYSKENVSDPERAVPYSEEHSYSIQKGNDFDLPGMKRGKIRIRGNGYEYALDDNVEFHAAADTNSGQLIFKYNLVLPNYSGLSLHHAEDKPRSQTSILDAHFIEEGILLLRLDPNLKLTGEAYTLANGKLKPYTLPVVLSEAFAPKQNVISTVGNIGLGEYIKAQN